MDYRTKLAFALVALSLCNMLLLGAFGYETAQNMLRRISERQLDALAESRVDDLDEMLEGWRDQVRLIRSRTQLRLSLERYNETRDPADLERIQRIVRDACAAVEEVKRIALFDGGGHLIASAGESETPPAHKTPETGSVVYSGLHRRSDGGLEGSLHSGLELDGTVIGSLDVVMDVGEVLGVTADTTGLGETGETILFSLEPGGRVQVLNDLRHAPARAGPPTEPPPSVTAALAGRGEVFELPHDYRGAEVWAASRLLPELGWGLVVKIDADEELARFYALRSRIVDVALALAAFAVVVGTLLGFRLARPIRDLSDVVDRVRKGETGLRAEVHGEDEVAVLARALNDWLDDMEAHGPREPSRTPDPDGR